MLTKLKLTNEQKSEISAWISAEISQIESNQTSIRATQEKSLQFFKGNLPAEPKQGSKYISKDVADGVNQLTPEMVKVFLSTKKPVQFVAKDTANIKIADALTEYCSKAFENSGGYKNIATSIRNGLLLGAGFLKTEWLEKESYTFESYEGLNDNELSSLNSEKNAEIEGEPEQSEAGISVKVKRKEVSQELVITAPAPDRMLISAERENIQDCRVVAERMKKTKSELINMGYDADKISELSNFNDESYSFDDTRNDGIVTDEQETDTYDYYECYIHYYLKDNKAGQNMKICAVGDSYDILASYNYDVLPYSLWSPILVPNSLYGESVAEHLIPYQELKTTLQRQINDNIYLQNFPTRIVFPELLTTQGVEQLKNPTIGQTINVKTKDNVNVTPLQHIQTPYTASNTFQLLNLVDKQKADTIGIHPASMAVNTNVINKTATEVSITENNKHTQLVSYIRNYAEFCLKPVFEKAIKLALFYDDSSESYNINDYSLTINVGLGTDSKTDRLQGLMLIAEQQAKIMEIAGPDSPFVNQSHQIALARDIAKATGIENYEQYLPEVDVNVFEQFVQQNKAQAMDAEAMAQQQAAQQAQMVEQAKSEIEQAKIQADVQMAQEKLQLEYAKLDLEKKKVAVNAEIATTKLEIESKLKEEEMEIEKELKSSAIEAGKATSTNIGVSN